ncbi:glutamate racemase [Calothrix sp. PCC 6303]|uniref:glutamate racemase n=1 Tax=Calothrix sp. PCC 6303 TaxID=1170562 RepID=UPI0002A012F4|nr:glutamate racemase [Calothrix sp. PCC 6303]AFZ03687.1 glutamate racemase [Calothrix sp. PCC 6303]
MFPSSPFEGNLFANSNSEVQRAPIGIFDSGVGGLTVLRELYRQLPNESIIYFGDTARLPYGIRSQAEIIQYVRDIITWMQLSHVKMVIMACNTSSALALEAVREEFNVPILGIILPGAKAAVQQGKRIGVIATPATAKSNAYKQAIHEINSEAEVWQVGCPEFVPLIEQNRIHDPYTIEVARSYLEPLIQQQIDTLVYGCTHYPHLAPIMRSLLPSNVKLIDPAAHVVNACTQELELLGMRNTYPPMPTRFAVSGCPQQFADSSVNWLGHTPTVEAVHFTDKPVSNSTQDLKDTPLCNDEASSDFVKTSS